MKIYINFEAWIPQAILYGVMNWSNICFCLLSRLHHHRERYFVFFQTIALSSNIIKVHSATIRRILSKQHLFTPRRKLENGMRKYVISARFRSEARSTFIVRNCAYVDFPRNALLRSVFSRARVSTTALGFFNQAGKYFRLTNIRGGSGYLAIYDFERSPLIDIRLEYAASLVCLCTNSRSFRSVWHYEIINITIINTKQFL